MHRYKLGLGIVFIMLLFTDMMAQQGDSTRFFEGKMKRSDLEPFSWFATNYNQYKPSMSVVEKLATHKKCSVLVVLGTWCSDSRELVPELFKVMDLLGWEQVELIGVDKSKKCSTVDITPLNVEYVPLILLFKDKKLKGKIVETTKKSIEEDLLELLEEGQLQK
ncbi:MAG: hypothetical protein EAY81_01705 [Bacteroidetes bacterium]|nr:MAG: hypothetical protein EAY81_01705 [Bacteroidota bacterium]